MKYVNPILNLIPAACWGILAWQFQFASAPEIALPFAGLSGWALRSALCEVQHGEKS